MLKMGDREAVFIYPDFRRVDFILAARG